jgi:hypothetical protein
MRITYLPVHRVMPAITDVDCYPAICCLKYWVPCVPLHVVGALIEVTHTRDVILQSAAGN